MYCRGKSKEEIKDVPFDVVCNNCGSHNVTITAFEHLDLEIKCEKCGSYLTYGRYNTIKYEE